MTTPPPKAIPAPPPADAPKTVRVTSAQLFAGAVEVQIDHFGATYRLRQTALGKLILTK
jgi:hemin uptake protein HemP